MDCLSSCEFANAPSPRGNSRTTPAQNQPQAKKSEISVGLTSLAPTTPSSLIVGRSDRSSAPPNYLCSPKTRSENPQTIEDTAAEKDGCQIGQVDDVAITDAAEQVAGHSDSEQLDSSTAYKFALEGGAENDAEPFYIGDQHGLGFFLDICSPDRVLKGNHIPVPRARTRIHSTGDLDCLQFDGALFWPSNGLCQQLLQSYFNYVHIFTPIVKANSFLKRYSQGGPQSYVSKETVKATGHQSRKALKRSLFKQAKCLYDAEYEVDKLTLIQSVLLMSFWYVDTEDRFGSWHWNGIAIGLCHSLGLHRDPWNGNYQKLPFSNAQRSLWRRIWWTCYIREVWLSLGYGRPLRINLDDCNAQVPSVDDMLMDTTNISPDVRQTYLPADRETLARIYIDLLQLTKTLGGILATHYRPRNVPPLVTEIERDEQEIRKRAETRQNPDQFSSEIIKIHAHLFEIYYQAALIVLYRPYILRYPGGVAPSAQEAWRSQALSKVKAAASSTTAVLSQLIIMDAIKTCPGSLVTAMKPAMQIYFLNSLSSDSLVRRHASHDLDLYMLVLEDMRDSFWTAGLIYDLFQNARKKVGVQKRRVSPELQSAQPATSISSSTTPVGGVEGVEGASLEPTKDNSFLPEGLASSSRNFSFQNYQTLPGLDGSEIEWDFDIESILNADEFHYALR